MQNNIKENLKIIDKYLNKDNYEINCLEGKEKLNSFLKTESLKLYYNNERPDYIFTYDNKKAIGLEHFEFNSSKTTRKGSKMKSVLGKNEKEFNAEMNKKIKLQDDKIKNYSKKYIIDTPINIDYYIENFKNSFNDHYKNIKEYKVEITEKTNIRKANIKMGFLIEDTTILGNRNESGEFIYPFKIKEIMDKIYNSQDIDFVIFAIEYEAYSYLIFREDIKKFLSENKFYFKNEINLIETKPKNIKWSVVIKD